MGKDIPPVNELTELLTTHSFEIEEVTALAGDTLIDVKILPDRAGDCLSHRGVAREVATLLALPLVFDPLSEEIILDKSNDFLITIENAQDCSRFAAALLTDIKIAPSPQWLQDRLATIGQKSINNIVDATNYVMYALGQPMHAYDADLFSKTADNKWHFLIRKANVGETIALLKDSAATGTREIKLTGSELLIVDGTKNLPIGLAGIKGGEYASINNATKNIIIEAANFNSVLIRQTARKHGINTDAVKRFENKPSVALPPLAINYIVKLIKEIAAGNCKGMFDSYPKPSNQEAILVRTDKVNKVLGLSLADNEIKLILERLGAEVKGAENGFLVKAPMERSDLNLEVDYIEEVGRIYGLDRIVSIIPTKLPLPKVNTNYFYSQAIRSLLLAEGFSEIMTSSFRDQDEVKLQNALASDKGCLRSSIVPGLQVALMSNAQNIDILGLREIKIFEIGKVFGKGPGEVNERLSLVLGVQTKKTGYSPIDDKILGEVLEKLRVIGVGVNSVVEKGKCEIFLNDALKNLPLPTEYDSFSYDSDIIYKPFSSYPVIVRDIAIWVEATMTKEEVVAIINEAATPLCVKITLFDEFSKDGRVSRAFRLVFQSFEKTLTDDEVEPIMDEVYKAVKAAGFETR